MSWASVLIWVMAAATVSPPAYLLALTGCAARALRRGIKPAGASADSPFRFAILVPAHNEEALIGKVLDSVAGQAYSKDDFRVYVIVDNCDDDTAQIAVSHKASVLERNDLEQQGKGFAISWALQRLPLDDYDGIVIIDADSVVDQHFLNEMKRIMAGRPQVAVQGYYQVLEITSIAQALRSASFALVHYVRPLGKTLFGGSCGLKGNGMAFSIDIIKRFGWKSFSIAEDSEQHFRLLEQGIKIEFAPRAVVLGEMPAGFAGSNSQNLRWESGRLGIARRKAIPLLWRAVRSLSLPLADAAVEVMIPPLAILVALATAITFLGWTLAEPILLAAGIISLLCLWLHVVGGLILARAPKEVWRALLAAPLYLIWKLALYLRVLLGRGPRTWVRTPRKVMKPRLPD